MASLELRNKTYRVVFMFRGKKYGYSLDTADRQTAEAFRGGLEKNLMLIDQGAKTVPEDVDIVSFFKNDCKVIEQLPAPPSLTTLETLCQKYLATQELGSMESNSLATTRLHLGHFQNSLGARFSIRNLTLGDLQSYVAGRRKKLYRGKPISPVTLRKEVASFRACWNWGILNGLVAKPFPSRGLVYPKSEEKPHFMTRAEIEKRVTSSMKDAERADLWHCLYLSRDELPAFLHHVQERALHPWIYPMVAFAAHTGARRSELLRVLVSDIDFDSQTVLIREKKRDPKQRTTRRVPLTRFLIEVLKDWLTIHPGGNILFCHTADVQGSKKRGLTTGHQSGKTRSKTQSGRQATVRKREMPEVGALTKDELHHHLKQTLAGGDWEVLPGWHCLRHSFISACASNGVDQRLIDEWTGHSTDEQRKRYRHLYPSTQQQAINGVFAEPT